jgi:tRNA A37 methylthiotransferase MiaB
MSDLRRTCPNLIIKTQLIVGFPGETWNDFFKTLSLMAHFDGIGVNGYARLKFTPAYNLKPLAESTVRIREKIAGIVAGFFHILFIIKNLIRIEISNEFK